MGHQVYIISKDKTLAKATKLIYISIVDKLIV